MSCSICKHKGHNKTTCYWNGYNNITNHTSYIEYIDSNDFYINLIQQLTYFYNDAVCGLDDIESHLYCINNYIDKYTLFKPESYRVTDCSKMNDTCSICIDVCNNIDTCYQCHTCNHIMHKKCIHSWFKSNNKTCPSCRTSWCIKTTPNKNVYNRRNIYRKERTRIINGINSIEYNFIDLLKHYFISRFYKDDKTINDIISNIPEHIIIQSLYSCNVLKKYPNITNGYSNLLEI